jgi:Domain of unknown function (DUF4357)
VPGRSVRLFLIDGTPQGMRTAEVGNWTGLALVSPRTDLARLAQRPEVKKTGVYILVGPSETSASGTSVYVGEGDEVWGRLTSHDGSKDFWTHVVVFVSKDENLTKAHVRWLEATLIREIKRAKRAEIHNGNEPAGGRLPEADTADMETYHVRCGAPRVACCGRTGRAIDREQLRWEDARAECVVRDGLFVIRQGSLARTKEVDSLGDWSRSLRKNLRDTGVLVPADGNPNLLRFTQEYAFESPSGAAAVVSGTGLNGRTAWKVKGEGISYKQWQAKLVGDDGADAP